ncbi:ABC transporter permease [Cohnella panacarvi]|uniref:ABC transporter permease n=1 Tax=Cohnella panacarvi TaxID=400776 RepID=UPI00047E6A35|nr:ABC transporter permease subunit [Cohnella panacarvi]
MPQQVVHKAEPSSQPARRTEPYWRKMFRQRQLILMSLPMVIYVVIFAYGPIWGWMMAFQQYKPGFSIFDQKWVGFDQFRFLLMDEGFTRVLRNTIAMSVISLVLGFVTAIGLALLLNEIKKTGIKRIIQTISYLPHFLSWIIVTGLVSMSLSTEGGIVNIVLVKLHLIDEPIVWLSEGKYFWGIVGATNVWKEVGWNTIIYLAAIASVDPSLYEAAEMDGAGRYRKIWNVTLPGIRPVIVILLILNIGWILNGGGFEIQYFLGNGQVLDYSETIDIFVLKYGLRIGNYSLGVAAGIFKTVVSIILLYCANLIAKRLGEERLV